MNTQEQSTRIELNSPQAEQVFNLLTDSDLNWTVKKLPLFGPDGQETRSAGIFRADGTKYLGTVGQNYEPFQNFELAETIVKASEGAKIEFNRGGQLAGGAKVYLQARLPDEFIGKSNVKRWLTALNAHDGSSAVAFGSHNTVVICTNTWHAAYRNLEKFRHTTNIKERIHAAVQNLRKALELDYEIVLKSKQMAETRLTDEMISAVIKRIFEVEPKTVISDEISTRKENQIKSFAVGLETEVKDQGKTLWALFNGITRYTNHVAAPADTEKKKEYLMTGTGYKTAILGFDECMKWIDENTEELAHS